MSDLARRGVSASKWGIALTVARIVLQIGSQAILARILGPEFYGVFGMALVVFVFSMFLAELGFGMFLLQRKNLVDDDIRFVATVQVLVGMLAAVALFVVAPVVAGYFQDPRVQPVLRWMAIACILMAATATANQLLLRDLNFRAIGLIDLFSYGVGYLIVGLGMALSGAGVMTLVAAWLTHAAVKLVVSKVVKPHPWRPLLRHPDAAVVFNLGRIGFFTLFTHWFLSNVDRVIIGRYLGPHLVGLYNAGANLSSTASTAFITTLQGAFLASGARVQQEPERLRRAFLQIFATIWVIAAPLFLLLAVHSDVIVALLYGSKWVGAGDVLRALLIAVPASLTFGMSTPVLWNTGRGYLEPLLQLPVLVFFTVALLLSVEQGVVAVAWVVAVTLALRAVVVVAAVCRAVGIGIGELWMQLVRGSAISLLVVTLSSLLSYSGVLAGSPFMGAVLTFSLPLMLLILLIAIWPVILGDSASGMVIRFVPRLSKWLIPRSTG